MASNTYYQKNREEILEKVKTYQQNEYVRPRLLEYYKQYAIKNKERRKLKSQEYYKKNREKIIERNKAYYQRRKAEGREAGQEGNFTGNQKENYS